MPAETLDFEEPIALLLRQIEALESCPPPMPANAKSSC